MAQPIAELMNYNCREFFFKQVLKHFENLKIGEKFNSI
jgi:hypothetical protein